jgi:hypothetical protein
MMDAWAELALETASSRVNLNREAMENTPIARPAVAWRDSNLCSSSVVGRPSSHSKNHRRTL